MSVPGGCCCCADALIVLLNDANVVCRPCSRSREGGGSLRLAVLYDHNAKKRACQAGNPPSTMVTTTSDLNNPATNRHKS